MIFPAIAPVESLSPSWLTAQTIQSSKLLICRITENTAMAMASSPTQPSPNSRIAESSGMESWPRAKARWMRRENRSNSSSCPGKYFGIIVRPPSTIHENIMRSTVSSCMQFSTVVARSAEAKVLAICLWVISAAHPARCAVSSYLYRLEWAALNIPIGATRITPPHPFELLRTSIPWAMLSKAPMQVMPGARRFHNARIWLIQLSACGSGIPVWVLCQLR